MLTLVANSSGASGAAVSHTQRVPSCPRSGRSAADVNSPRVSLLGLPLQEHALRHRLLQHADRSPMSVDGPRAPRRGVRGTPAPAAWNRALKRARRASSSPAAARRGSLETPPSSTTFASPIPAAYRNSSAGSDLAEKVPRSRSNSAPMTAFFVGSDRGPQTRKRVSRC